MKKKNTGRSNKSLAQKTNFRLKQTQSSYMMFTLKNGKINTFIFTSNCEKNTLIILDLLHLNPFKGFR